MKIVKKVLIAVLVIVVALVAGYYTFPEKVAGLMLKAAASQAGLTKKEIQIDDHKIVYLEGGKGPTILLLHGYTGSKENWFKFAPYLTKNYHVVIPDIPGYGESSKIEKDSYDLSNQMLRLHKFAQAIELKKFHIVGNSLGGFFAGTYAVRYPDEIMSVGLFDAAGVMLSENCTLKIMMEGGENPFLIKDSNDMQRFMTLLFVKEPFLPYPLKKVMFKTYLTNRQFYEKEAKEGMPYLYSLEKDLPKIKVSTLILWGDQDKIIDISSVPVFEKGLKNHKTVIIKDCGHCPMMEKPQETATQYLDFVKGIK
jgi:pimeloyl-ACP methyl ester carboxylesterase